VREILAIGDGIPAEGREIPAIGDGIPAEGREILGIGDRIPAIVRQIPAIENKYPHYAIEYSRNKYHSIQQIILKFNLVCLKNKLHTVEETEEGRFAQNNGWCRRTC
jgi:hypothetical protein